jgi:hypothetical protein
MEVLTVFHPSTFSAGHAAVYLNIQAANAATSNPPQLLDVIREQARALRYRRLTKKPYVHWIRHLVLFHGKQHH